MAEIDAKVMKFVEETLKKAPSIELDALFERAKKVSPSIKDLTKRQFNARYPLQVKRRAAQAARPKGSSKRAGKAKGRRGAGARAKGRGGKGAEDYATREKIRGVFLQFASDIAGAEERRELVKVLASVDRYVDQVLKGTG